MQMTFFGRDGIEGTCSWPGPGSPNYPAALAEAHAWSHEDPLTGKRGQGPAVPEGAACAPGERGLT